MWYNILFVVICIVVISALLGFIYSQVKDDLPEEWNEDDIP